MRSWTSPKSDNPNPRQFSFIEQREVGIETGCVDRLVARVKVATYHSYMNHLIRHWTDSYRCTLSKGRLHDDKRLVIHSNHRHGCDTSIQADTHLSAVWTINHRWHVAKLNYVSHRVGSKAPCHGPWLACASSGASRHCEERVTRYVCDLNHDPALPQYHAVPSLRWLAVLSMTSSTS
jgi:hypothetical protein